MAFSQKDDDEVLSEMNVTPLVDVMLVLLIVFIVTAPLMTNAVRVTLPKTEAVAPPDAEEPLIVSIDAAGVFYIGERPYGFDELERALAAVHRDQPERAVQLQADQAIDYGSVARVMAMLQTVGINKIAMLTQR